MELCVLSSAVLAQAPPERSAETSDGRPSSPDPERLPQYKVIFIADCDNVMLQLNGKTLRVGLLGVEAIPVAPNQGGKSAKKATAEFLKKMLNDATVRVEFGVENNQDRAYLYRSSDKKLLNQEIIDEGYGISSKKLKHRLRAEFDDHEKLARSEKKGLWNPDVAIDDARPIAAEPEPPKKPSKTAAVAKGITWSQYVKDCGLDAQEKNEARTENTFQTSYKGRSVHWTGIVYSVRKQPIGKGFTVQIRMSPTESSLGTFDLTLSAGEDLQDEVSALNEGDKVEFEAVFKRQGGRVSSHQFDLDHIEPLRAPARKSKR